MTERTLANLVPAGNSHAILNCAFAIDLDPGRDTALISGFVTLAPALMKLGYDLPTPINALTVTMTPSGGVSQSAELGGYAYSKKSSAGTLLREVSLRDSTITIVVHDYSRWDTVWKEVSEIFELISPVLGTSSKVVRAIALQYADQFSWRDDAKPMPVSAILRSSEMLAVSGLKKAGSWHSHHGYFLVQDFSGWAKRRLDNVNIDVNTESSPPTVSILTLHRYHCAPDAPKERSDFVTRILPALYAAAHQENKRILADVLSSEVCQLISLRATNQ